MLPYQPTLMVAETPEARMDALCAFIEFWLGKRQASYGEAADRLAVTALPMPLRRLYEFAGRWPTTRGWSNKYAVPAFDHQDSLIDLPQMRTDDKGRIIFVIENQGVWDCRTLANGDDPPVWCVVDDDDKDESCVSESLSRFLMTFVLRELTIGSMVESWDGTLARMFESHRAAAVPIWINGDYVGGNEYSFYLWGDVLVGSWFGHHVFAAKGDARRRLIEDVASLGQKALRTDG